MHNYFSNADQILIVATGLWLFVCVLYRLFGTPLFNPSDFFAKPYLQGANQLSHGLIGLLILWLICSLITYPLTEDLPKKELLYIALPVIYTGGIELIMQGWRGLDTVIDSLCVCILPYAVIGANTHLTIGSPIVEQNIRALDYYIVAFAILVLLTVVKRLRQNGWKWDG